MTPRRALAFQALVAALLGLLLVLATPGRVQRFWLDMQLRWAAPSTVGQGVMLIDLDEASLHRHDGRLPHARIGAVIDALRAAGARAVVLDLPLNAPQADDPELARTLGQTGAPVVLALAAVPSVRMPAFQNPPPPDHWVWARLNLPAPSLAPSGAVWQLGVSSTPIDFDNRLRRWQLWHAAPEGRWPALPLAVLQALNQPLRLAPDEQGRVTPLWMLERNALPTQSFRALDEAVAAGQVTSPLLRAAQGQVVFMGSSAQLGDTVLTPFGPRNNTDVLAQTYVALRDGQGLQAASSTLQLGLLGLSLLPALLALLGGRGSPLSQLRLSLVAAGLVALLLAFAPRLGLWLNPTPFFAVLFTALLMHWVWHSRHVERQVLQQERERQLHEAAGRAQSAFLANVSHELRTPLSALLGVSELMAQGSLDAGQRRHLQLLGTAGRRLQSLVDELLDLNRLEAGRLELQSSPSHLPELLQQALESMQEAAKERGLRVALSLGPKLPEWVLVDAPRLSQVLRILLANAVKFTPQGKVELEAKVLPDERLQLSVIDTGIGIASSQLERIFEPFVAARGAESERYGGTGLGLALSRRLVRLMGGDIEVQSLPGAGSRFSVALPLSTTAAPAGQEHRQREQLPAGLQLLLGEPDDVIAEVLTAQLANLGVQVERAASGHLALALAKRLVFDAILLDLDLPGLDGHRVARAVREHEQQQDLARTPILTLSAHAFAEDLRASVAAGCDAHLSKPLSQQRLRQALLQWAPSEARAPRAPRLSGSAPVSSRSAHAAVFLGHWGASWAAARLDLAQSRRLLQDMKECADSLEMEALQLACADLQALIALPAPQMLKQHQAEQALQAAVEEALVALRGLG
jgi:signal transduction histidine kinase/CheY-like chemotaxis protein